MGLGVALVALAGLYLLFAGSFSLDECVAAGLTAALGTALLLLMRAVTERAFSLAAPWHRILGTPLAQLIPDAVRVGSVLLRALAGRRPEGVLSWQRFRHGFDDRAGTGRRGLTILAVSLAPNGYVLDLPGGADAMLVHRLVAAPEKPDTEWPL